MVRKLATKLAFQIYEINKIWILLKLEKFTKTTATDGILGELKEVYQLVFISQYKEITKNFYASCLTEINNISQKFNQQN